MLMAEDPEHPREYAPPSDWCFRDPLAFHDYVVPKMHYVNPRRAA
jgi:hypothetical protein